PVVAIDQALLSRADARLEHRERRRHRLRIGAVPERQRVRHWIDRALGYLHELGEGAVALQPKHRGSLAEIGTPALALAAGAASDHRKDRDAVACFRAEDPCTHRFHYARELVTDDQRIARADHAVRHEHIRSAETGAAHAHHHVVVALDQGIRDGAERHRLAVLHDRFHWETPS